MARVGLLCCFYLMHTNSSHFRRDWCIRLHYVCFSRTRADCLFGCAACTATMLPNSTLSKHPYRVCAFSPSVSLSRIACTPSSSYLLKLNVHSQCTSDAVSSLCDMDHGSCKNSIGSYSCSCDSGWKKGYDPTSCADVDECATLDSANQYCQGHNANCSNTDGSFACVW